MSTQFDRLAYLLTQTRKDWDDIRLAAGLTRAGIKKWRDGNFKSITSEKLYSLVDLFGCDARWLATGEGTPFPNTDIAFTEVQMVWLSVNAEGRREVLEHVRYIANQARFLVDDSDSNGATAQNL
jgi:phage repressor protein C with HTH and peptisase S24 domain